MMSDLKNTKTAPWLREIVNMLETAESFQPEPYWMQGDHPLWVQNIGAELIKTMFPAAKLKRDTPFEPGEVAAMLGHQVGYWQWIGEHFEREMKSGREVTFEELERAFGKGFEERTKKYWGTMIEEVLPAFEAAVKFALQRAVDQEFHVMAKFFAAFSRALARKPSLRLGVGRTSTGIYWVMLTSWRRVEEFGSVPELHRRLCACIYLGSHVVGDLKRVEKICERMGLSYKEIESRKERAKNPDMNA